MGIEDVSRCGFQALEYQHKSYSLIIITTTGLVQLKCEICMANHTSVILTRTNSQKIALIIISPEELMLTSERILVLSICPCYSRKTI